MNFVIIFEPGEPIDFVGLELFSEEERSIAIDRVSLLLVLFLLPRKKKK